MALPFGSLECFVIIKCTKFGQLILRKIIKIVATRYQILRLKCTKFDFGWGSLDRSPSLLAGFKGPTSKGREERRKGTGKEGEGKRKGEGGEKWKGWESISFSDFTIWPLAFSIQIAPCVCNKTRFVWLRDYIVSFRVFRDDLCVEFCLRLKLRDAASDGTFWFIPFCRPI